MAQILSNQSVALLVPTASGKTYAEVGINLVLNGDIYYVKFVSF